MENIQIINIMRNMSADREIDLEEVCRTYPKHTALYLGRPEMVVMTMSNNRNMQMFRGGKIQILGCIPNVVAESMRKELIVRLKRVRSMEMCHMTEMIISNLVVSAQLQKKLCLRKIVKSDADLFHEIELFPAALIRKWQPVHIAAFHNGKVILTGLKSEKEFFDIASSLMMFLESSKLYE